jgi:hypothetical protein
MSKQSVKNKLMELVAGTKQTDKHIIICFDDEIPDKKQSELPRIVFKDFRKNNEKALENKKS